MEPKTFPALGVNSTRPTTWFLSIARPEQDLRAEKRLTAHRERPPARIEGSGPGRAQDGGNYLGFRVRGLGWLLLEDQEIAIA